MNGSSAVRGYLLQTIICLLDALQHDDEWESLRLEPLLDSEKVDIVWHYRHPNGPRVTQVKSSQNQINKRHAEKWAEELEVSERGARYELILIGPCSDSVARLGRVGQVEIPSPRPLDVNGLLEQCAHRLDIYYENRGHTKVSAGTRELLAKALVTELERCSDGIRVSREEFEQLLDKWLAVALEEVQGASRTDLLRLGQLMGQVLAELPRMKDLHLDHPDVVQWRTTVRRHLDELDRALPGNDYARRFDLIAWHPPNKPATGVQRALFAKACGITEGLLKAAVQHIEEKLQEVSGGIA